MAKLSFSLDETTGFYKDLRFLTKKRRTTDRNMAKLSFPLDKTTGFYKNLRFLTKKRRTTGRALANPWTPKSKREPCSGGAFGKKHCPS